MTWENVTLSLFDGFLGAIVGGAVAAVIALRTTKEAIKASAAAQAQAIEASAAAQDRDRALNAALRAHEFAVDFTKAAATTRPGSRWPEDLINQTMQAGHLALKTAEFARPDDDEFVAWLTWVNTELVAVTTNAPPNTAHVQWVGSVVGLLERRLLAGESLARPKRPTEH